MINKAIMGVAAGVMALTVIQAPAAEAKGKHHGHKHHKHFVLKWYTPYHYVHSHDCGFYYWKWKHTGKLFWKSKYFACKGFY